HILRLHRSCLSHILPRAHPHHLSLHDALPISNTISPSAASTRILEPGPNSPARIFSASGFSRRFCTARLSGRAPNTGSKPASPRSEEHTSELQSRFDLVCRLMLEKRHLHVIKR